MEDTGIDNWLPEFRQDYQVFVACIAADTYLLYSS